MREIALRPRACVGEWSLVTSSPLISGESESFSFSVDFLQQALNTLTADQDAETCRSPGSGGGLLCADKAQDSRNLRQLCTCVCGATLLVSLLGYTS